MDQATEAIHNKAEASEQKYLSFQLGGELFAVNIMTVREIVEYTDVTPVPMMPEFIMGALNLRGRAVPVVDLTARLRQGKSQIGKRTCVIITEIELDGRRIGVGLLVDAVSEVCSIADSAIEPAPTLGGQVDVEFIRGMGRSSSNRFVIILDLNRILTLRDLERIKDTVTP